MAATKQEEIIEWAIERLEIYEHERKLYNWSAILLSVLDVLCGIIALFYTSMLFTSVVASILCGTAWGARAIQLVKCQKLAQALKVLSVPSLAYIAVRKKRSEYMKNTKVRNIVIGILTILGVASVIVFNFVPALASYVDYTIYVLAAILPADLYAVFNNAKLTTEEINKKIEAKKESKARKEAQAELKAKQEAELKALTVKKLEERKIATEVKEN